MFHTFEVNDEVTALYESRAQGSEVLLFKRNEGLLSRINVPEKGDAVEERLARSFEHIRRTTQARGCAFGEPANANPNH